MAAEGADALVGLILESAGSQPDLDQLRIYRHTRLETDLVVHLHRRVAEGSGRAGNLGERLASLLREYGMVEHSVWIEAGGLGGRAVGRSR